MTATFDSMIRDLRPADPLEIVFPDRISNQARRMVGLFPGSMLYAVKCNPKPQMLTALWQGGIRHFDAASIEEIALVRGLLPDAVIAFMNPVKPRAHIGAAWELGVTIFAVDSQAELDKVLTVSPETVIVRLALPKGAAGRDQSGKFGVPVEQAADVLRRARPHVRRLGLTFHVGSQCADPAAYAHAMELAAQAELLSGVGVDVVDVGGGFPAAYLGYQPPDFADFVAAIRARATGKDVWCEPGRALVAGGEALVTQVVGRKNDSLFLNDGIYGGLSPDPLTGHRYLARTIKADGAGETARTYPFRLFGPTCDSWDCLPLPYDLPEDIAEGDWIVFEGTGAYAGALRTRFNGMGSAKTLIFAG